jgi:DNA transformation protein
MAISEEYLQYVLDQLDQLGPVISKKMFGGVGLFHQGLMFALISKNLLYFKVDDSNRQQYEERGLTPFQPFSHKPMVMPYYPVPADILEDPEHCAEWAQQSFAIALKNKK